MASDDGESLEAVLGRAQGLPSEDSIVLTGVVRRANAPDEFLLQTDPASRRDYSLFKRADVLGPLIDISATAPAAAAGETTHAVRVRRGATGILVSEDIHRVGAAPLHPAILAEYGPAAVGGGTHPTAASLDAILAAAPSDLGPSFGVFPGVVRPGPTAEEILLLVRPPDTLDYAVIRRSDILDPQHLSQLPAASVPLDRRDFPIHLVRVREGAKIRVVTGMRASVLRQPSLSSGCGCGGNCGGGAATPIPGADASLDPPDPGGEGGGRATRLKQVPAGGRRCRSIRCLNARGKWDLCCADEYAPCDYQWATGLCTTAEHWLYGQRCFCACVWAPL